MGWGNSKFITFALALACLVSAAPGVSDIVPSFHPPLRLIDGARTMVDPNEFQPQYLKPLFTDIPEGLYVAVGTERGFIGATLSPKFTGLLLLDYSADVVKFNRLNIALLQLSTSQEDYLNLRLYGTFEDWALHPRVMQVDPELRNVLLDKTVWNWWNQERHDIKKNWKYFQPVRVGYKTLATFEDANYLENRAQFDRLRSLALSGKIQAEQLDFRDVRKVKNLARALEAVGQKISVLDLSNAWWPGYIGQSLSAVLPVLAAQGYAKSQLVLTESMLDKVPDLQWSYFSFRFSNISSAYAVSRMLELLQDSTLMERGQWNGHINPTVGPDHCGSLYGSVFSRMR